MKTEILQYGDDFTFRLRDENGKIAFSSERGHFYIPFVQDRYVFAADAKLDAVKLSRRTYHLDVLARYEYEAPIATEISADDMIDSHYANLLSSMESRVRGNKGDSEESTKDRMALDMISDEMTTLISQTEGAEDKKKLQRLLNGFKKLRVKNFGAREEKQASIQPMDEEVIEDLLLDYGERACVAIRSYHPKAYPDAEVEGGEGCVNIIDGDDCILRICMNNRLNVNSIMPCGNLSRIYPEHSVEFYQRYWKPVVEEIEHFYLDDNSMIIIPSETPLPDIPNNQQSYTLSGWDVNRNRSGIVDLSFRGDTPIWIFESSRTKRTASAQSPSRYTEQEYFNAIVKCLDPQLESINGRTGAVVQVIPLADHIEVDVDFGRGLDTVRLSEDQIEIVT